MAVVEALVRVDGDRALKLARCGRHIEIEYWELHGKTTVATHTWCNQPKLCTYCAHARGVKLSKEAARKVMAAMTADPSLRPWLVTFTLRNGPDLPERLEHLLRSYSAGWQRRKDCEKGKRGWSSFNVPAGSISSVEIKRGANSGEWHVHLHCVWLVPVDAGWSWENGKTGVQLESNAHRFLCDEWHEITRDSFVINAKPFRTALDLARGEPAKEEFLLPELFEVFKYLTKPGDTAPVDQVEAWCVTQRKRLVRSHGILYGLAEPDSLDDERLDGPSWRAFFLWQAGAYQRRTEWQHSEPRSTAKTARTRETEAA